MVECKVCGNEFKRIQWTHLKKHEMSISDYKDKFPDAKLEDDKITSQRKQTLENMINRYGEDEGRKRWENYKKKQSYSNSFEYKKKKHGWSYEEFQEFNKSRGNSGEDNGNYGRGYYQVWCEKYGKEKADEMNKKLSRKKREYNLYEREYTPLTAEQRKKMSESAKKRIERQDSFISYNPDSIPIIEEYGNEHGYRFQHAENGGEYMIPELYYYVDGYDGDNNVIIEYYEKYHYNGESGLREYDIVRRNNIINKLHCKFVEINYKGDIKVYEN